MALSGDGFGEPPEGSQAKPNGAAGTDRNHPYTTSLSNKERQPLALPVGLQSEVRLAARSRGDLPEAALLNSETIHRREANLY